MIEIFIVAWTGGYDPTSYVAKATKDEAISQAAEWSRESDSGDTVEVLRVDLTTLFMERVEP